MSRDSSWLRWFGMWGTFRCHGAHWRKHDPEHLPGWTSSAQKRGRWTSTKMPFWLAKACYCSRYRCLWTSWCPCRKEGKECFSSLGLLKGGSQKSHRWLFMLGCCRKTLRVILKPQVIPTICLLWWQFQSQPPPCPTCPVLRSFSSWAKKAAYKTSW